MRKRETNTPGHPTDIRIGICRGLGLSREDTANVCGVSVPTVDLRKNEPTTEEWEEWAKTLIEQPSVNHKAYMERQMIRRSQKALQSIDNAMDSDDPELALRGSDRVLDRVLPKTQKVETTSEVTERHIYELPEAALAVIAKLAEATKPRQIEATVIDVTPEDE